MGDQKRRTEIQIETHEITIIRFGTVQSIGSVDERLEQADVIAHGDIDSGATEETQEEGDTNEH